MDTTIHEHIRGNARPGRISVAVAMEPVQASRIAVRLTPRGGANRIDGWRDGVLQARVRAPAIDGRANQALIALLASAVGVPPTNVSIVRGRTARAKLLQIAGLTQTELEQRLRPLRPDA